MGAGRKRGGMSAIGALEPVRGAGAGAGGVFRPLSAEDEEQQPAEIESLCMNCYRHVSARGGEGLRGGGRFVGGCAVSWPPRTC